MQMLNQKNKKIKNIKMKKSQLCLFGSLLIIAGIFLLSMNHLKELKKQIFSEIQLGPIENHISEVILEDMPQEVKSNVEQEKEEKKEEKKPIDYSQYHGVLEIPKIRLKRGFYDIGNRYNTIEKNVTVISGSTMPDVPAGNLILAAHSGDAYISYFAYLYKLTVGDQAYVTYKGNVYKYQIVNIYNVPKTGTVTINRDVNKSTLTMITCTKNSDTEQTVYIAELI